jgi:hypothetical protein
MKKMGRVEFIIYQAVAFSSACIFVQTGGCAEY